MQTAPDLFGTNLVAMVTPMHPDGSLDDEATGSLVDHLVDTGCDGLVVAGTTGEAPTLDDAETARLVGAVVARAAGRARTVAGVGSHDTAASVRRARAAAAAGADALLVVCPYYSRPTQAGVVAHCRAVADATDLPVMLYDVPARTGLALSEDAIVALARHPRIRAVKDAKGDLFEATALMTRTSLAYYCGIDELNLPYLAAGATGLVSVVGHVAADPHRELIRAVAAGDLDTARSITRDLLPLVDALMRTSTPSAMAKAALVARGVLSSGAVRLPLVEPTADERSRARLRSSVLEAIPSPA